MKNEIYLTGSCSSLVSMKQIHIESYESNGME